MGNTRFLAIDTPHVVYSSDNWPVDASDRTTYSRHKKASFDSARTKCSSNNGKKKRAVTPARF
jgi:hypothetical protein